MCEIPRKTNHDNRLYQKSIFSQQHSVLQVLPWICLVALSAYHRAPHTNVQEMNQRLPEFPQGTKQALIQVVSIEQVVKYTI